MQIPVRVLVLLRPSVSAGILLAMAYSTFALAATPFLFDALLAAYDVSLTEASLIGVGQMGGFVVGSWGGGRILAPRRRIFVAALGAAVAANLASATLPPFALLVLLRTASGLSLGVISWFAWVQVFGDRHGTNDVAVIGPVAGMVASPVIALFAGEGGASAVFALLAALAVVPLVFNRGTGAAHRVPRRDRRSRAVPAARWLLVCLGSFTLGGSAVFQYAVVLGTGRTDLTAPAIALVFSANSLASIPAARWPWSRGVPAPWLATTALCAATIGLSTDSVSFAAALVVWGFAFWMGVPGVFDVLAARSAHPGDRAGDAQSVMAAGRVAGPFLGGALLDGPGPGALAAVGGGLMLAAAGGVYAVRVAFPARSSAQASTAAGRSDRPQ